MSAADTLLAALDAELGQPLHQRASGADDEVLQALRHRVRAAELLLAANRIEEAGRTAAEARALAEALRPGELADQVVDHADGVRRRSAGMQPSTAPDAPPGPPGRADTVPVVPPPDEAAKAAVRRTATRWIVIGGLVLLVAWPLMIWAAVEYDMPALRLVASLSMATVFAGAVTGLATSIRKRRKR